MYNTIQYNTILAPRGAGLEVPLLLFAFSFLPHLPTPFNLTACNIPLSRFANATHCLQHDFLTPSPLTTRLPAIHLSHTSGPCHPFKSFKYQTVGEVWRGWENFTKDLQRNPKGALGVFYAFLGSMYPFFRKIAAPIPWPFQVSPPPNDHTGGKMF